MQLKMQRSQRASGIIASNILFCLDVRADYAPEEQDNIRKYRLGGQVIYNSQSARNHLEKMNAQLDRTQEGTAGNRAAGLARGVLSLAMAKMSLNISIDSLGRGHHIECKDLEELLETEDTVREACKGVTRWLEAAATFDGSETVIEYEKGEEKVHVTEAAPPLLTNSPADSASPEDSAPEAPAAPYRDPAYEFGQWVRAFWSKPQNRKFTFYGGGILFVLFLMRSCT
jgi:hypothetical protein